MCRMGHLAQSAISTSARHGILVAGAHCRPTKEVQVTLQAAPQRRKAGRQRLWSGILAQRRWLWPVCEGLLGVHSLREIHAALHEAAGMTPPQWWRACRCVQMCGQAACSEMCVRACTLAGYSCMIAMKIYPINSMIVLYLVTADIFSHCREDSKHAMTEPSTSYGCRRTGNLSSPHIWSVRACSSTSNLVMNT